MMTQGRTDGLRLRRKEAIDEIVHELGRLEGHGILDQHRHRVEALAERRLRARRHCRCREARPITLLLLDLLLDPGRIDPNRYMVRM